ncbi:MAG: hypothetical protein HXS49_10585 [Theionarchaea archaeon]|nr:hypothetical protein [Theionarchaea archaeon]
MNIRAVIARMYLPSSVKVKGILDVYVQVALSIHEELIARNIEPNAILENAAIAAGKATAETLRREAGLHDTFEDAVDSWIIGSKAMGVTISVKEEEDMVLFHHMYCPLWEIFRERGTLLCSQVCLPMVKSTAQEICQCAEMVVIKSPDMENTCIKALRNVS